MKDRLVYFVKLKDGKYYCRAKTCAWRLDGYCPGTGCLAKSTAGWVGRVKKEAAPDDCKGKKIILSDAEPC